MDPSNRGDGHFLEGICIWKFRVSPVRETTRHIESRMRTGEKPWMSGKFSDTKPGQIGEVPGTCLFSILKASFFVIETQFYVPVITIYTKLDTVYST